MSVKSDTGSAKDTKGSLVASLLARAAEEQVTASEWSPADGLGEEIEATIAEIAENYNVSLLARSLAEAIVGREMAQSGG